MITNKNSRKIRLIKHKRVRKKISGSPHRPRMCVYASLNHIYVQIVDDSIGHTLVSASTADTELKNKFNHSGNVEAAKAVGALIAQKALKLNITKVVFDRGGFPYHGRIAALADEARANGLKF